jgi:signal transduction histidine kinase
MQQAGQAGGNQTGMAQRHSVEQSEQAMLHGPLGAVEIAKRKRIEAVVETLATMRSESESLAGLAHDARNMVTALALYCDLLEEPGVLSVGYRHYGSELRLLASSSRRLVEKMMALQAQADAQAAAQSVGQTPGASEFSAGSLSEFSRKSGAYLASDRHTESTGRGHRWEAMPAAPIKNLAAELEANRNLLAALAGQAVALTVETPRLTQGGNLSVRLTGEDLTRLLVNLVKNATEAMPVGGTIKIALEESGPSEAASATASPALLLSIEDNGPGIPAESQEWVFESGYTTRAKGVATGHGRSASHRGLGLAISRSIVEAAGGRIRAATGAKGGARIEIELPAQSR